MYIKKIVLKNFGPVNEMHLTPRMRDGNPVPIVLVGQNGSGKSLTLAAVLDTLTESRRASFIKLQEVEGDNYLRVSSRNYVKNAGPFSHVEIMVGNEKGDVLFNEVVSRLPYDDFVKAEPDLTRVLNLAQSDFPSNGFFKKANVPDQMRKEIESTNFLYFPYYRYEAAYWMNLAANVDFIRPQNYYGQAKINPIRANIIEDTKRWILNVLLDREIYEKKIEQRFVPPSSVLPVFIGYDGPNARMFDIVNEIMLTMLKAKDPTVVNARVGISPKGNREIAVFLTRNGFPEEIVAYDIAQMSSGELMTLGLVTEIVRAYEVVKGVPPQQLRDVDGVVLIDEVDLHLHISFQKSVLPIIIRKFPKVQFLLTTHSPFFLLGMAETGEVDIFNMPLGSKIEPEEFVEFQSSFNIFVKKNLQFKERYDKLVAASKDNDRPLAITEGKTDWRHIKTALQRLRGKGEYLDLEIDFLEFDDDVNMGDVKLGQMCEHAATLPQAKKLIFVFDRDNPKITKQFSGDPEDHKYWGNSVYSLCLPIPEFRAEYVNLSIELYYKDEDIRTRKVESGRRLWFSNEIEIITEPTTGEKLFRAKGQPNTNHELSKKVFDQPANMICDEENRMVGLSKSGFVEQIIMDDVSKNFDISAFRLLFDVLRKLTLK